MVGKDSNYEIVKIIVLAKPKNDFEKERNLKWREVQTVLHESEEICKNHFVNQHKLHLLYQEQITTSNIFTTINKLKRDYGWFLGRSTAFPEINEEADLLLKLLEKFEEQLDKSGKIIRTLVRDLRECLAKIMEQKDKVAEAKTMEDLANMDSPNWDWVKLTPDPELQQLADQWNRMQLKARTTEVLQKLRALL